MAGGEVVRKQSRPIGEFGGNLGTLFWMIFIPTAIYYWYGCTVMNQGQLMIPNGKFWYDLYFTLPAGIAIRPTMKALGAITIWIVFQAAMEIFIPAKIVEGVTLKNGRKLKYPMNGLVCFFLSHVACYAVCGFGLLSPYFIWSNMGALLTCSVIIAKLMALWLYIDLAFCGGATSTTPSSRRTAMYFDCHVHDGEVHCMETGAWHRISPGALMITLAHWYYIFDYNLNEPAYLTTTDIRHDLFGWMLTYGDWGFLVWYYSFAFCGYLAFQDVPLTDNYFRFAIGTLMHIGAMYLFRVTNIQKHNFRTYIAEGGDLSKYKVWGKPVEYIKTEEGSYLLISGWWSFARHFNYIGDLVMCLGWTIACSGPRHGFPWIPLSYCLYFWLMDIHRMFRDENRCRAKYKKDWAKYEELVPWRILPNVF
eukprot:CAMPEP_0168399666 /NCGR_PEP_ID=MMETSP0228-20121227/22204_1 /TAXON_ID=133427 /ORGANISM="Protoceratium reticulatum, Strain CCCM 535 (=CCMP 1889)" /LENGTH=420 /DNA_ID=CAMNT_0008413191 /DNA_START=79 /DNA_END=1342 /DNA_ORIENTATION=-